MNVLVTVDKFGPEAKEKLENLAGGLGDIKYNLKNRKLSPEEIKGLLIETNPSIIIAGTERYDSNNLKLCGNLKLISRVGIGLDSIDFRECGKRNIYVSNTPDAPSNAVAELVMGQIFNSLRGIQDVDLDLRKGLWDRYSGRDLSECSVGIIGYGRIGKLLSSKLSGLAKSIFINDLDPEKLRSKRKEEVVSDMESILRNCDVVSLHIPMNNYNKDLISNKELGLMKKDSILINTSRGGIVNEKALYGWLSEHPDAKASIDVFCDEPYNGDLIRLKNCYLTPHMGSCTVKSRLDMEVGSVLNVEKFLKNDSLK